MQLPTPPLPSDPPGPVEQVFGFCIAYLLGAVGRASRVAGEVGAPGHPDAYAAGLMEEYGELRHKWQVAAHIQRKVRSQSFYFNA